jgi:hypothetical protein
MKIRSFNHFLSELAKVPVEWHLAYDRNLIRTGYPEYIGDLEIPKRVCPICAVANSILPEDRHRGSEASEALAAAGIFMSDAVFQRIILTADGVGTPEDTRLMLMACGLSEPE